MAKQKPHNLKEYLKQIGKITAWFDAQEEIDIEEAMAKVKQAAGLIKSSRDRLAEVENEFKEIRKKIDPTS